MINIFHIITKFDMGGAERIAINIAKSKNPDIQYHIFEVVKGNSEFTDGMINEMQENGILIHRSFVMSTKFAIIFFPVWFLFSYVKIKPVLIHTHTEIPDLSIFLFHKLTVLFRLKVNYIRTIHNTQLWNSWDKLGVVVERFYKKNNSNIAISLSSKKQYEIKYCQNSIPIIYNGIERTSQKKFNFLKPNKINVLFAGRFEYQKGIEELIQVIRLMQKNETYYFHVIGTGSLEEKVRCELKDCNNVKVYSKIYNLSQYFASFDYLFMPSNFEGLPLMSIEASFSKTPIIANSAPGLDETLPIDWKLKVKNNSIDEYMIIFNKVIPNSDRVMLANEAFYFVNQHFTIKRMQDSYERMYLELIKNSL